MTHSVSSTNRRILVIAGYPDSILEFRGALLRAMVADGCQVHVAAPNIESDPALRRALEPLGVVFHEIPLRRTGTNPFADLALLLALRRLICEVRPTATLAYTIKPVIYGTIAAWIAHVPRRFALVTGLGYAFTNGRQGLLKSVVGVLYAFALSRAHKIFFQNPDDESLFRQLGIVSATAQSIVVNGSGVDLDAYAAAPLPDGTPAFLMISRLLGDKGIREYVEAARILRRRHAGIRFALAGWIDDGPDAIGEEELRGWIEEGSIAFLGRLNDVRAALRDCSVYVLPSYREGTPRTVLEAMAVGRPIITTDAPGCRETVIQGINGFLVPVKSVTCLVDAMECLLSDASLRAAMGRESRRIAENKYDVAKVNAVMLREMGIAG